MGVENGASLFAAMALLLVFTLTLSTVVQARSQNNRFWWAWGLLTLVVPFAGYALWRLLGATDDGSPDQLLRP